MGFLSHDCVQVVYFSMSNEQPTNGVETMNDARTLARREQLLRELASDLADQVRTGDLTEQQANEWLADKADQWVNGV